MLIEYLPYVQFLGQFALIGGAIFAGYQFLLHRREREDAMALEIVTTLQSPQFRTAYARIWALPFKASPRDVEQGGHEMEEAIDTVMMTFEMLGIMVHNRQVNIELVDQAIGGFLRESWRRVDEYVHWKREQIGSKRYGEWYQWLAEHLAVETRRSQGAYDAFRAWKP